MKEFLLTDLNGRVPVPHKKRLVINKTMAARLAGALMALLAGMGMAQQQQGGLDKAMILKELDRLEQTHKEKITAEEKSIGGDLMKALSNSKALLELYEGAVFATKFEGEKKDNAEFRKWKSNQEDTLRADDFQAALALHANYLYLTLLRSCGEDEAKLNESLVQHVFKVWLLEVKYDLHKRANAELLDRPVTQGVLARRFQLGSKLGGTQEGEKAREQDKTWEWVPANTDGMLDKTVFPFMRAQKNVMLIPLWDKRIANELAHAKRPGLNDKATQFYQQTLPRLNWQRARDLVFLGRDAEGFSAMVGILRQNANLTDYDKYVRELRDLLAGGEAKPAGKSE